MSCCLTLHCSSESPEHMFVWFRASDVWCVVCRLPSICFLETLVCPVVIASLMTPLQMSNSSTLALPGKNRACGQSVCWSLQFQKLGARLCGSWTLMPTCTTLQASLHHLTESTQFLCWSLKF